MGPVLEGPVTALARVSGPQGRTFHGEAEVRDAADTVVARFHSVFRIARGQGFDDPVTG